MPFSAAAAGNFQFFLSLGGGCQKAVRQSAAAARKFQFFFSVGGGGWKRFGSRRRRLKIFENFLKNFLRFEKFCIKKGKLIIENRLIRN